MKRHLPQTLVALVALLVLSIVSTAATAQGPPQLTAEHEILKGDVGTWDAECQMWMAPDAQPMPFQAVEKNRLLEGGTWVVSEYRSDLGAVKFEGHGIFGYDPYKKKYVGTWVDNMNMSVSQMEGTYDKAAKTLTMHSKARDPETGELRDTKSIVRYLEEGKRIFEMHVPGEDGKMWKMMEMKYTRRK